MAKKKTTRPRVQPLEKRVERAGGELKSIAMDATALRYMESFPDPYERFESVGFMLINLHTRMMRTKGSSGKPKHDDFFNFDFFGRLRYDIHSKPYLDNPETASKHVRWIKENYPRSSQWQCHIQWFTLQHKEHKHKFLWRYENSLKPSRFVLRAIDNKPVDIYNMDQVIDMCEPLGINPCTFKFFESKDKKLVCEID